MLNESYIVSEQNTESSGSSFGEEVQWGLLLGAAFSTIFSNFGSMNYYPACYGNSNYCCLDNCSNYYLSYDDFNLF